MCWSGDTEMTEDESRQRATNFRGHCTCEEIGSGGSPCLHCQNEQFANSVANSEVVVGHSKPGAETKLLRRIDGGSFGDVYLGSKLDNEEYVAVKVERQAVGSPQQLLYEGNIYQLLAGGPGIPTLHWYGLYGSKYNMLVMDLLGPSLNNLLERCDGIFSIGTVLQLVEQMVTTIEFVHEQGFVHRDISPSNFMIGRGKDATKLFLIDYGHSKRYNQGMTISRGSRYSFKIAQPLVGTPRFASIHAHMGQDAARRDDMESLGYIWVYFLRGSLPWQSLSAATHEEKLVAIREMKRMLPLEKLCKGVPQEFAKYIHYTRHLRMFDQPDYTAIRNMFQGLARKMNIIYDARYDWTDLPRRASITSPPAN